jgi:hypothetical protein
MKCGLKTSVGWAFDFFKKPPIAGSWEIQTQGASSGYLKKSEPNNDGCGYLKKNQNERTTSFGYFKNLKELLGFMKEPEKK